MDNRQGTVLMNVSGGRIRNGGRKRRIVKTDLVTGGLRGMEPDNFLKGVAKAGIKLFTKDPAKEQEKLKKLEGDKVMNVLDKGVKALAGAIGLGTGLKAAGVIGKKEASKVTSIDTSGFNATVSKPSLEPSIKTVKSVTPMISPLPPSVPSTPGDAAIEAAMQESQRNPATSLPDAIVRAAEFIPESRRAEILNKAQGIYESGSNGLLTKAQKQLQELSAGILPKTKPVKDAEKLLTAPQHSGNLKASTETLGFPTAILLPVVGVILLVIMFAVKK